MALVRMPKPRYGDSRWLNPKHVVRITHDHYRPFDKAKSPEPITVVYTVDGWKHEYDGHIQDELANLLNTGGE